MSSIPQGARTGAAGGKAGDGNANRHVWNSVVSPRQTRPLASAMADTKQTKTIGEHYAAAELARRGWAPALTRDGLERTDILAVMAEGAGRRLVEIQVKTARGEKAERVSWPLGNKSQAPSAHEREYFVLVAVPLDHSVRPRSFVVPRIHVAAAAWIAHMNWLTDPGAAIGKRNAPVDRSRVGVDTFIRYEDRWDLLELDQADAPVLLPPIYREYALSPRVGLREDHEWQRGMPEW